MHVQQIAPNLIQFDAFAQPPKKNKDFETKKKLTKTKRPKIKCWMKNKNVRTNNNKIPNQYE